MSDMSETQHLLDEYKKLVDQRNVEIAQLRQQVKDLVEALEMLAREDIYHPGAVARTALRLFRGEP